MITFHAVCYAHHRRNDGTYPVKIKVTFKRKHRHLPTNLTATAADLTRSLHIKAPHLIVATNELVDQMRGAVADLTYFDLQERDCDWVVEHIRRRLTADSFRLNFVEWCSGYKGSRMAKWALTSWRKFAGDDLDINDITAKMLLEYVEWFKEHGRKGNGTSINYYLIQLGAMYRAAKDKFNDEDNGVIVIPKSPFERVKVKRQPPEGQRNLGCETIQRLIDTECSGAMRRAIDIFLVSFALMGANLADLWSFKEVDGWWIYNRSKTTERRTDKAEMRVRVPDCIRGRLAALNAHFATPNSAQVGINAQLAKWAAANGVEKFTMYAARHSWASIARATGVEKATIDECLAHIGDYKIADIYAERNWGAINAANDRVLALFRW